MFSGVEFEARNFWSDGGSFETITLNPRHVESVAPVQGAQTAQSRVATASGEAWLIDAPPSTVTRRLNGGR